ncbi:hypothetical protein GCM10011613_17460 [Cellvibrio zantedeschiae]|uniref:Uncharacterized protein n=1 Tax=Cellvibrio zantedeschiae TaxID=1237077 RepID=A0ABQ3B2U4_9GAMM|nr:hypothetical protein GCM10011613_17460 [Cellvibrio zantedeschiae]
MELTKLDELLDSLDELVATRLEELELETDFELLDFIELVETELAEVEFFGDSGVLPPPKLPPPPPPPPQADRKIDRAISKPNRVRNVFIFFSVFYFQKNLVRKKTKIMEVYKSLIPFVTA